MIEDRVRELVAEVRSASDAWTPRERIDVIAELETAIAMLQGLSNVEAVTYVEQRQAADRVARAKIGIAGRGAPVEIAMARGVSRATVDYQLAFARQLVDDHPALLAACLDGQASQSAAKHIVQTTEPLTSDQRRAIDGELAELACELTPGEVRKASHRKVAATDPKAAEKRARTARARKAVRAIMHGDGTGSLAALLPAEQAVAAWQTLDHEARCRRSEGDERSIDALMCDLLVERVTGQSAATDLNLEVGVVVAATSLLGIDDQPAKLVGHRGGDYGVLPAELARQLADTDSAWARRLVCDPVDGRLLFMDPTRRRFDGALRKLVIYRDGTSRRPYSNTPIYEIDHIDRYADGGPTIAANAQGLGKSDHVIRDLPGWSVAAVDGGAGEGVRWTTPTGHAYESRPPPILGWGNRRQPPSRSRHGPRRVVIELYRFPLPVEYAGGHHRQPDVA
ncbi:MAG TPA: DUF222 domain-containing protein [Nocardioidaceae bacterium]|nr:DUF222 domain-containing protein [Nocardioidaceae bacterium]